jgi:cobalt/nickel transport system permease protein
MHPEIDRYAHLESPVHSWDPALKIAGFGVFIFGVAMLVNLWSAALGLSIAIFFLWLSRISIPFALRRVTLIAIFMLPFFVLLPIKIEGNFSTGFDFSWVWEREKLALVLMVRALAIAVIVFPMLGTAPFHLSMKSLQDLGIPKILIQSVLFTYRYLFVYLEQLRKMRVAMRSRAFVPGFNRTTFRTYGYQVGMLLVISFEQTERILSAMKSRGYDGTIRILYQPKRVGLDWVKFAGIVTLTALLAVGDRVLVWNL